MKTETVLGIHINVQSDIAEKARSMQRTFGLAYPGNYSYEPHVTIYLSKFGQSDFTVLRERIIQAKLQSIRLVITGLYIAPHRNEMFISLGLAEHAAMKRFHAGIVNIANTLRGNQIRSKDVQRIREKAYTPLEIKAIRKYGYLRVGSRFHPHITLGTAAPHFKLSSRLKKIAQALTGKSFMANEVVIGLYAYDKTRHDYTKVIREQAVSLGA